MLTKHNMIGVYEIDYTLKDVEAFKASGKEVPTLVVAESVSEAVKKAKEFEDENTVLLKCNLLVNPGKVAIQKKLKGLEPVRETA